MNYIASAESLDGYMAEINRYPLLTPEEEFIVAERYYKTKHIDDAHRLVVSNLRYVVRVALEFRNYGFRLADLIQEGNIGLMHAVKKFNPYKGFRLITYALWWIRASIQEFILNNKGLVKKGAKALKKRLFYKKTGLKAVEGGKDAFEALAYNDLSLDAALPGENGAWIDMLKDDRPGQEEMIGQTQHDAIIKKDVARGLSALNDKERLVIKKRVMADEPESLKDIGATLGITRERVRQIESTALKKLKSSLS